MKFKLTDEGREALSNSRFQMYKIFDGRPPWNTALDSEKGKYMMGYIALVEIDETGIVSKSYYKAIPELLDSGLIENDYGDIDVFKALERESYEV